LVKFSESVTVATSNGSVTPKLVLMVTSSGNNVYASYVSGSGTDTLKFSYTVLATQYSSNGNNNYLDVSAVNTNNYTIRDSAGNDATLTVPVVGNASSLGVLTPMTVTTDATISLITPSTGPLAGGNTVLINGTNFYTSTNGNGVSGVTFGGTVLTAHAGSGVQAAGTYLVNSLTQITVVAPAGTGTVSIVVTGGQNTVTKTNCYTYVSVPTVTSLSVDKGPTAGGQAVVLTGTNLSGVTVVKFGSAAAVIGAKTATTVAVTTPAHVAGVVDLTFGSTAGGITTNSNYYTFYDKAVITTVSPVEGKIVGGETITLTGSNFVAVSSIKFGITSASNIVEALDGLSVTCTAPNVGTSGKVSVVVVAAGGTTTKTGAYTFLKVPTLTSVTPAYASKFGGDAIVIKGATLLSAQSIDLADVNLPIDGTMTVGATSISLTIPAGTYGTTSNGNVVVTTLGGVSAALPAGLTFVTPAVFTTTAFPNGLKGTTYTPFTVDATATPAITSFKATGLPSGLTMSTTGVVSGKPTVAGSFLVKVTASNGYPVTATIPLVVTTGLTNTAPTVASAASATPNPATVSDKITFTASGADAEKDTLSYSWDFGDSSTGVGSTTTHTYSAVGTYSAVVTISDGLASVTSTVTVVVGKLSVLKAATIKFNFVTTGKDSLKFSGTLVDSNFIGFAPLNNLVTLTLGDGNEGAGTGTSSTYVLDKKGTGKLTGQSFKLTGKQTNSQFTVGTLKYAVTISNTALAAKLVNLGFANATIKKPAQNITMPIGLEISGLYHQTQVTFSYTATINKSGTGVSKK
jgi:hypothetical protein